MAVTCGNLIDRTIDLLQGSRREALNTLNTTMNSSVTSVVLDLDPTAVQIGTVLSIDLELMYVTGISSQTATVIRGYRGSTAAAHTAGAVITVNPRYSRFSVFNALNDDLNDLSAEGLGKFAAVELTYNPAVEGYNLTGVTSIDEIVQVSYQDVGPEKDWPPIPMGLWSLRRNAETDDFSTGFALITKGYSEPGMQLRVVYRAPFSLFTAESSDAQTVAGLPATANDLPPLGAAMRLVYPREGQRNQIEAQPDTRRADEVPAGALLNAARGWQELRAGRILRELQRQERQYPTSRF